MKKAAFIFAALVMMAGTGLARITQTSSHTIGLEPTEVGKSVSCSATACMCSYKVDFRGRVKTVEAFSLQLCADIDNGEVLQVLVDTTSGQTDVLLGEITIQDGLGSMILMSHAAWNSDRPGDLAVPLSQIVNVRLAGGADLLAVGTFLKPGEIPVRLGDPETFD